MAAVSAARSLPTPVQGIRTLRQLRIGLLVKRLHAVRDAHAGENKCKYWTSLDEIVLAKPSERRLLQRMLIMKLCDLRDLLAIVKKKVAAQPPNTLATPALVEPLLERHGSVAALGELGAVFVKRADGRVRT